MLFQSIINSTKNLMEAYLEKFDRVVNFTEEYHIMLQPNNHPIVHAPRKYPIHMRDEILSQRINRKVDEPMHWFNRIVYVHKSNCKLRLRLDPKDLNINNIYK